MVKQLLELVHDGNLWIGDQRIPIIGELIHRITGLPKEGPDLGIEFPSKHEDTKLAQSMKDRFNLKKGKRGYQTSTIGHQNIQFTGKLLACKLMRKCRPHEVPAPIVSIAMNCAEGYIYKWAEYIAKEFLEDVRDAQKKGRPFHYSWLIVLIALVGWKEPTEAQFVAVPLNMPGAARYASLWVS